MPARRRGKRSTKNSKAERARPDAALSGQPPAATPPAPTAAELGGTAPNPQAELAAAEQLLAQQFPPPPPPPPPAAAAPGPPADDDDEFVDGAEQLAGEFSSRPDLLLLLEDEELAAAYELAFGYIAERKDRPHWDLKPKSALRLGRLTRRVLLKHPELAGWLAQWLADVLLVLVLSLEVGTRVAKDRKLDRAIAARTEEAE